MALDAVAHHEPVRANHNYGRDYKSDRDEWKLAKSPTSRGLLLRFLFRLQFAIIN
jgi:hypothetical protein